MKLRQCLVTLCAHLSSVTSLSQPTREEYDFIVVGGGTAGLAVANRLSEDGHTTVLVLEKGGWTAHIETLWSTPHRFANGVSEGMPHGVGLGGSSAINGRIYLRAEQDQFNLWESGVSWAEMWRYYLRSENFTPPSERYLTPRVTYNASLHGTGGPVSTSWPLHMDDGVYLGNLQQSYAALGVPYNIDPNGGTMRGFSVYPRTQHVVDGRDVRVSARGAYYLPVRGRRNLDVVTHATVTHLIWKSQKPLQPRQPQAVGVEYYNRYPVTPRAKSNMTGRPLTVRARHEVIVAAGTYGSAPLLERSGVGNPAVLEPLGIDVVLALPGVGENLQDQTSSQLVFQRRTTKEAAEGTESAWAAYVAFVSMADVLGSAHDVEAARNALNADLPRYARAMASVNQNAPKADVILELLQSQAALVMRSGAAFELLKDAVQLDGHTLRSEFWLTQPLSRGSLHLRSPNVDEPPILDNNFFMADFDLVAHIAAARFVRRLFATPPLVHLVAAEISPGLDAVPVNATDAQWGYWLKNNFHSAWHAIGTTSMLPRSKGGVVDPRMMVYGTANVRVVDCGIFPFPLSGHPSSTIYAFAERASDLIMEDLSASRAQSRTMFGSLRSVAWSCMKRLLANVH